MNRRSFIALGAAALSASDVLAAGTTKAPRFKAVAFDGFPIFDPRPVAALAESMFAARGAALMAAWRTRQFEYQWLRSLGGKYADFLQTTQQSLIFASRQLQIDISVDQIQTLGAAYTQLNVWPDVPDAIATLRSAGLRLVCLSNMTHAMLDDGLRRAGLRNEFENILSTDAVKSFKPDPRAYAMGTHALKLSRDEILFAAFAGWDVSGAKWFGYPTFWVNRSNAPPEELDVQADASGPDLDALVKFVVGV
jgi:2-haloacid dehalogenase